MRLDLKSCLLVVDMQNDSLPNGFYPVWNVEEIVNNISALISACRSRGIPVIFTQQTYRPDGHDAALGEPKDASGRPKAYVRGSPGWEIIKSLEPLPEDVVIEKTRWSAFFCTPLEVILRGLSIQQIIVTGVVTDGCVQTTVYDAFFRDYHVVLVKDACGAFNQACHEAAVLNMVNWVYGMSVITTEALLQALKGQPFNVTVYREPNSVPFTHETIHTLYSKL